MDGWKHWKICQLCASEAQHLSSLISWFCHILHIYAKEWHFPMHSLGIPIGSAQYQPLSMSFLFAPLYSCSLQILWRKDMHSSKQINDRKSITCPWAWKAKMQPVDSVHSQDICYSEQAPVKIPRISSFIVLKIIKHAYTSWALIVVENNGNRTAIYPRCLETQGLCTIPSKTQTFSFFSLHDCSPNSLYILSSWDEKYMKKDTVVQLHQFHQLSF